MWRRYEEEIQGESMRRLFKKSMRRINKKIENGKEKLEKAKIKVISWSKKFKIGSEGHKVSS